MIEQTKRRQRERLRLWLAFSTLAILLALVIVPPYISVNRYRNRGMQVISASIREAGPDFIDRTSPSAQAELCADRSRRGRGPRLRGGAGAARQHGDRGHPAGVAVAGETADQPHQRRRSQSEPGALRDRDGGIWIRYFGRRLTPGRVRALAPRHFLTWKRPIRV